MTNHSFQRHIPFEGIVNFRDLGGYPTHDGHSVIKQRLFRSGEFQDMTQNDAVKLKKEIGLTSVIDLRNSFELEQKGIGLLSKIDIQYHSILSLYANTKEHHERFLRSTSMGEVYVLGLQNELIGKNLVYALETIAESTNHPLVFHCVLGKDRTGILAALILGILGVSNEDIIHDYSLTTLYVKPLIDGIKNTMDQTTRQVVPDYVFESAPESMRLYLSTLEKEYGSAQDYLKKYGLPDALIHRLRESLLV